MGLNECDRKRTCSRGRGEKEPVGEIVLCGRKMEFVVVMGTAGRVEDLDCGKEPIGMVTAPWAVAGI